MKLIKNFIVFFKTINVLIAVGFFFFFYLLARLCVRITIHFKFTSIQLQREFDGKHW